MADEGPGSAEPGGFGAFWFPKVVWKQNHEAGLAFRR